MALKTHDRWHRGGITNAQYTLKQVAPTMRMERRARRDMTEEKLAALVDAMLSEFKNDFTLAAILQPHKELPLWKVVLTRHKPEPEARCTIIVDLHAGVTDEVIKAAVRKEILKTTEGHA